MWNEQRAREGRALLFSEELKARKAGKAIRESKAIVAAVPEYHESGTNWRSKDGLTDSARLLTACHNIADHIYRNVPNHHNLFYKCNSMQAALADG